MLKWNRSIAAILSAALVFSMAPAGAIAAVNPTAQEDNYENNEDMDAAQSSSTEEADSGSAKAEESEANQSGVTAEPDCPEINGDFCPWTAEYSACRRLSAASRTAL